MVSFPRLVFVPIVEVGRLLPAGLKRYRWMWNASLDFQVDSNHAG